MATPADISDPAKNLLRPRVVFMAVFLRISAPLLRRYVCISSYLIACKRERTAVILGISCADLPLFGGRSRPWPPVVIGD